MLPSAARGTRARVLTTSDAYPCRVSRRVYHDRGTPISAGQIRLPACSGSYVPRPKGAVAQRFRQVRSRFDTPCATCTTLSKEVHTHSHVRIKKVGFSWHPWHMPRIRLLTCANAVPNPVRPVPQRWYAYLPRPDLFGQCLRRSETGRSRVRVVGQGRGTRPRILGIRRHAYVLVARSRSDLGPLLVTTGPDRDPKRSAMPLRGGCRVVSPQGSRMHDRYGSTTTTAADHDVGPTTRPRSEVPGRRLAGLIRGRSGA